VVRIYAEVRLDEPPGPTAFTAAAFRVTSSAGRVRPGRRSRQRIATPARRRNTHRTGDIRGPRRTPAASPPLDNERGDVIGLSHNEGEQPLTRRPNVKTT
jgi:hypothetical protein